MRGLFYGNFDHSLDPKSRLIIPARFRDALTKERKTLDFFLTPGLDKCVFLFATEQYATMCKKLEDRSTATQEERNFARRFFGEANPCTADGMGRIILPDYLKQHASIQKDVKIVGVSTRIEIWDRVKWEHLRAATNDDYESQASGVLR
ncbi:MAG: division/cell wall cluster transcriptional repressor MraZ [Planctomycetes bacterium]|nr:division/cell wall cluster transcriptional repressor MraZ [Planctomycetota bacterium]MBI3847018.1 division/cell wall cluster transcriptional repressor MraZ [Planctomycetota bacterium]